MEAGKQGNHGNCYFKTMSSLMWLRRIQTPSSSKSCSVKWTLDTVGEEIFISTLLACKSPIYTERYSLIWYGAQLFAFPLSYRYKRTVPVFVTLFLGYQAAPKQSQEVKATHTAFCWLLAGKKLLLIVAVELFIYHFRKFYIIFRQECYRVDSKYVVS